MIKFTLIADQLYTKDDDFFLEIILESQFEVKKYTLDSTMVLLQIF